MDLFVIRGGTPLSGRLPVRGSKNAALPILAAALAADGETRLANVPALVDVTTLSAVLRTLGVDVHRDGDGMLVVRSESNEPCVAEYDLVRKMRASVCVLGPLLGRRGTARVSLPGGCNIGHRPIDLHLRGLASLGADVRLEHGYVVATASSLIGAQIDLAGPQGSTVTGTCNVMTAACFAKGRTVITSAAREPEVVDLGHYLNAGGASISGLGTDVVEIEGTEGFAGVEHQVIPDRIEAATLLIAGLMTGGEVTLENVVPTHLTAVLDVLRQMGAFVEIRGATIRVHAAGPLSSVSFVAEPYPGIPTDVQAQLTALLTLARGKAEVVDRVFPDRFLHLPELARMGADVRRAEGGAHVFGVKSLSAAPVMASDLRASAALLLAALSAEGDSILRRVYHLDRGYERLEDRLAAVGGQIRRLTEADLSTCRSDELFADPTAVREPHFAATSPRTRGSRREQSL